jgi:hypothetical protein
MRAQFLCSLLVLASSLSASSQSTKPPSAPKNGGDFSDNVQSVSKVPSGVLLVKGAWASASDSVTPVPEGGSVANNIYSNQYFGMSYALPPDWEEKYKGPPPSDSGRYVLVQLRPADTFKGPARGTILVTAQDMFFTPFPVTNALDLVNYSKNHLQADYKVELPPTPTVVGGRPFTMFAYWSPIAELHWYVLATEVRCHAVQIIVTSRDTKLLENLIADISKMKLTEDASPTAGTGGGASPVCVSDYATEENLITRVDPVLTEHKFNPVPVRIIIDKDGNVKHIHFLSAFPDQAKAVSDALKQWKFKRYLRGGKPLEVETGIMFGRPSYPMAHATANAATE